MKISDYPSPNYNKNRFGFIPMMIVNHITGGSNVNSALNWFQNLDSEVSAHFVIDTNGDIYQCVDMSNTAWANGTTTDPNSKLYWGNSDNLIVKQNKSNANFYSISIEHVNVSGGKLTDAQLKSSIELHKYIINWVRTTYGYEISIDRTHICGHADIAPLARPGYSCPGKDFPFGTILDALKGEDAMEKHISFDTSEVVIKKGSNYAALCIPRTLPNKEYYSGPYEIRTDNADVASIQSVQRKYTARSGQTGDLYYIYAHKPGNCLIIANLAGKSSSFEVIVV